MQDETYAGTTVLTYARMFHLNNYAVKDIPSGSYQTHRHIKDQD